MADLDKHARWADKWILLLSKEEKVRSEQFFTEKDRARYVTRRGILRMILGRYLVTNPQTILFHTETNNKPRLICRHDGVDIRFNASHSCGIALCAFACNREIGIDIERLIEIREMDDLIDRFFHKSERKILRALPMIEKKKAFFKCWTRKEALLKARGVGLYYPLDALDVLSCLNEDSLAFLSIQDSNETTKWVLRDINAVEGFASALALQCDPVEPIICVQQLHLT
ncbi:MAG: 4'-phosphopantetheinyl transferase superfamily protein [Deltaproteobacteria bacterium]|nr:4'-phosphopantetheinyl transferase superfamily protein [Deltaproteobacteria bacterium]